MKKMLLCFCSLLLALTGVSGCAGGSVTSVEADSSSGQSSSPEPASSAPLSSAKPVSSAAESAPVSTEPDTVALIDRVSAMKLAAETDKILTVVWQRSSLAQATFFQKDPDGNWSEVFATDCYIGKNGVTADKEEGDGKTPVGAYSFGMAFGRADDPGSVIPYHKLEKNDFWVDDPNSKYYNQFVNTDTTEKDWFSAEHLITVSVYQYALSIGYNTENIPGKGSAIFLHCLTAGSTGGCVALPEELVVQLLRTLDAGSRIVIVQNAADLADY
ncbi:MAG: L,D-transpeptidase family protein [Firmicutes bacterium]|nr:L,D-transpeptidase family protein [Bacillota bacterium]